MHDPAQYKLPCIFVGGSLHGTKGLWDLRLTTRVVQATDHEDGTLHIQIYRSVFPRKFDDEGRLVLQLEQSIEVANQRAN